MISPSHLVVTVTIFILRVRETKAACVWNGDCLIQCINSNTESVSTEIENLWPEREVCHDRLALRLRTLPYPNNTIESFWFSADVKIATLEVYLNNVERVLADAFNADAFRTVKKLTFETFELQLFVNGTFNGLDELEVINIKSARGVSRIETGILDRLTKLQEFTFEQSLRNNPELSIQGLTGSSVALSKLEYVKIRYNLTSSIRKSTFISLRNVKRLDLSSCQINSIEDNSFDPISETIEELDLSGNALTTVTYGVFSMALPNIKTVNINGNSWDCVCDLMAFRSFIEQYQSNFVGYNCASPTHCRISNILESDCFDTCEITTTSTTISTTTNTSTTSTATTVPDANLMMECPNDLGISDTISIKRPIGYMTISENEYGEANLNIETQHDANSVVVIRFDEKGNSVGEGNEMNCFSRNDIASIPITDLKDDVVYFYCLMSKTSTSVSPFDCISYTRGQNPTKPEGSKIWTVTLVVVLLLLGIVLGMAMAFWMSHNPFLKYNSQKSKICKESVAAHSYGANVNTITKFVPRSKTTILEAESMNHQSCTSGTSNQNLLDATNFYRFLNHLRII